MKPDGKSFGTICLLDNKENSFSTEVIELMRKMRDMIEGQLKLEKLVIQNAEQAEALKNNIRKLEGAYEELKINEEKYRFITENTTDYIWVFNFNKNRFTYASPNVYQIRGYTVDEILEQNFENAVMPESLQSVKDQIQEAKRCLIEQHESEYIFVNEVMQPSKNGDVIWTEYTAKCRLNHNNEMEAVGVSRNIMERKQKEKEILFLSTHDCLTGAFNRSYFEERAILEINRAERNKESLSLIMIDLDFFKNINDTYGHPIGDKVLKQASKIMGENIRNTDLLARIGGEEFIILLPETAIVEAANVGEKIRKAIEDSVQPYDGKLTVSIGVAEWSKGEKLDDLYKKVDKALYQAKDNGRNQVIKFGSCLFE